MKPLFKKLGLAALVLLAGASVAGNVLQHRQIAALKTAVPQDASTEIEATVAAVGRLMVLPDETPTIATVTDPEQLRDQAFFASAKVGDKVLIFSEVKKAVLYDPVADKILEIAPLTGDVDKPTAEDFDEELRPGDVTDGPEALNARRTVNTGDDASQ